MRRLVVLLLALLCLAKGAAADTVFPKDAGMLDIRAFGAHGNGRDDDTGAILRAIAASGEDTGTAFWQDRPVYLPNGVYRVSGPLLKRYKNGNFASGLMLIGESRERTIIRLIDHAPGFNDPASPKAVIFTSAKLIDGNATSGGKDYLGQGEGNDAYMNFIENMTVEIGNGNPGAIGIDFLGNNLAAIRNVAIRAPTGSGMIGLSMTRKWPGPAEIADVEIEGFAIGIASAQTEYGITLERLRLKGQQWAAIRNENNALSIRDIEIEGPARPIVNSGDRGFVAIDGGKIGAASPAALFRNAGYAVLRRVQLAEGAPVSGVLNPAGEFAAAQPPTWLPKNEPPPPDPAVPLDRWVSPARFGATGDPGQNATAALRQAMATGAPVLYLPHGTYVIDDALEIPATLQRIAGMSSTIRIAPTRQPNFARDHGMVRITTDGPPLIIDRLAFDNTNQGDQMAIELSGSRDLVGRDLVSAGVALIDRKEGGGKLFLDDVCCGRIQLSGGLPVFARQLDTEGSGVRILNRGSPLSILGIKTEGVSIVIDNEAGAHTDLFGGLLYIVRDGPGSAVPAFINEGSWLSASFVEESLRPSSRYEAYVGPGPGGHRKPVPVSDFPQRGFGRFAPNLLDEPR